MKKLDLNYFGVQEMNAMEMKETDGGIIWLLIAAAVVLLCETSCVNGNFNIQIGNQNSNSQTGGGTISADSTLNGNHVCVKPLDY